MQITYTKTLNNISSINIISNIIGYVTKRGNSETVEKNIYKRIFNKINFSNKNDVSLSNYLTSFMDVSCPYIKLKPKKVWGRRKNKQIKTIRVKLIDQFTSKLKAFIRFSNNFKNITGQRVKFIANFENQLKVIYLNSTNQNRVGVTALPIIEKINQLHISGYKFKPYKWKQKNNNWKKEKEKAKVNKKVIINKIYNKWTHFIYKQLLCN